MPTDVEIARAATPRPIREIAAELGIRESDLHPYGHYIAKFDLSILEWARERVAGAGGAAKRPRSTPLEAYRER